MANPLNPFNDYFIYYLIKPVYASYMEHIKYPLLRCRKLCHLFKKCHVIGI